MIIYILQITLIRIIPQIQNLRGTVVAFEEGVVGHVEIGTSKKFTRTDFSTIIRKL